MYVYVLIYRNDHEMFEDPPHPLFNECNQVHEAIESISLFCNAVTTKDGRELRQRFTGTATIIKPKKKSKKANNNNNNNHDDDNKDRDNPNNSNSSASDSDFNNTNNNNNNINTNNNNNSAPPSRIQSLHRASSSNSNNNNRRSNLDSLDRFRYIRTDHSQNEAINSQIHKMPPINATKKTQNRKSNASNNNKNASNNNNNNNPKQNNDNIPLHLGTNWADNQELSTLRNNDDNANDDAMDLSGYDACNTSSDDKNRNQKRKEKKSKAKGSKKTKAKAKKKKSKAKAKKNKKGTDSDDEYVQPAKYAPSPKPLRKSRRLQDKGKSKYTDDNENEIFNEQEDALYEQKVDAQIVRFCYILFHYV